VETIDQSRGDALERIAQLVAFRKIATLVVGLPVRLDGSEGDSAAKVRRFSARLRERIPATPIVFVDESLTTSTAASKLRAAGRNAKQQKSIIDQAAAVEILNLWMGIDGDF
jgi:putative holliday junction resolvase